MFIICGTLNWSAWRFSQYINRMLSLLAKSTARRYTTTIYQNIIHTIPFSGFLLFMCFVRVFDYFNYETCRSAYISSVITHTSTIFWFHTLCTLIQHSATQIHQHENLQSHTTTTHRFLIESDRLSIVDFISPNWAIWMALIITVSFFCLSRHFHKMTLWIWIKCFFSDFTQKLGVQ